MDLYLQNQRVQVSKLLAASPGSLVVFSATKEGKVYDHTSLEDLQPPHPEQCEL